MSEPIFTIEEEINSQYRLFNALGTQLTLRLLPSEDSNPMSHFLASDSDLFEHTLQNCDDYDMVGITISNKENVQDRAIWISSRRRDQLTPDVISSVFGKVAQSNARFNALDKLVLNIHYVKMPISNGGCRGIDAKGRPRANMAHLKRSILEVKAENNCLAHALVIAIAKLTNDPNYVAYRKGKKKHAIVNYLLASSGIDLTNC
jgi:hypothetical protein